LSPNVHPFGARAEVEIGSRASVEQRADRHSWSCTRSPVVARVPRTSLGEIADAECGSGWLYPAVHRASTTFRYAAFSSRRSHVTAQISGYRVVSAYYA